MHDYDYLLGIYRQHNYMLILPMQGYTQDYIATAGYKYTEIGHSITIIIIIDIAICTAATNAM